MVLFRVLTGNRAGQEVPARAFPFWIGRAAGVDLRLEASGVWDRHARVDCRYPEGFELSAASQAPTHLNGHPVPQAWLRLGDVVGVGAVRLQFWLSPTRQAGLRAREWLTWVGLAALAGAQVAILLGLLA